MNGNFYGLYNDTKDNSLIPREFPLSEFYTSGYYKIPFGAKILEIFAVGGGRAGSNGSTAGVNSLAAGGVSGGNSGFLYFEFLVEDFGEANSLYIEIGAGGVPSGGSGGATTVYLNSRSGTVLMSVPGSDGFATNSVKIWQYTQAYTYSSGGVFLGETTGTRTHLGTGTPEIVIRGDCSGFTAPLPGGSVSTANIAYDGASLVLGNSENSDWVIPPVIQNYTSGGNPIIVQGGKVTEDRNGQHANTIPVFTYSIGFPGGGGAASTTANGGKGGDGFKGSGGGGGGGARTGFSGGTGGRGGSGYVGIYPIF